MIKTKEEIKKLKESWLHDPCWDIEETEGFEEHRVELLKYRLTMEEKWETYSNNILIEFMSKIGTDNKKLGKYIMNMENKVEKLEDKVMELEDRLRMIED